VKPVPASVALLTVTGIVPVDVKTTDCVDAVFSATLPNATLVVLLLNTAAAAFNCTAKVLETLLALAESVTDSVVETDATVAANVALVALAATVTVAGTVTAELLLNRLTLVALVAAALSVTVQVSLPDPVMEELPQARELKAAVVLDPPVPLNAITAVGLVEELLTRVSCPVTAPAVVGSNSKVPLTDCPGFNVTGSEAPVILKPAPVRLAELTVTGCPPVDVTVIVCEAVVFNATLPNATLAVLTDRIGAAGLASVYL
jgi:4-hydroxy-3-methylbut-2-en-1-yl diphosphate synthase IspG/GcpE